MARYSVMGPESFPGFNFKVTAWLFVTPLTLPKVGGLAADSDGDDIPTDSADSDGDDIPTDSADSDGDGVPVESADSDGDSAPAACRAGSLLQPDRIPTVRATDVRRATGMRLGGRTMSHFLIRVSATAGRIVA